MSEPSIYGVSEGVQNGRMPPHMSESSIMMAPVSAKESRMSPHMSEPPPALGNPIVTDQEV